MGHVYQSLAVAESIPKGEAEVLFTVRLDAEKPRKQIRDAGYKLLPWSRVIARDRPLPVDSIVFDLPTVTESLLSSFDTVNTVAYGNTETNLPSTIHQYADAIVSPLAMRHGFDGRQFIENETIHFIGPSYLILRSEFNQYADAYKTNCLESILLTFGGADPGNITTAALNQLIEVSEVDLTVVLGPAFEHHDEFQSAMNSRGTTQVEVHENTNNMAALMHSSDFVLTSPGLTLLESLYIGVPTIALIQNDQQRTIFNELTFVYDFADINDFATIVSQTYESFTPDGQAAQIGKNKTAVIESIIND
jgi:spore coat polysaccharide biosynthesis predicted glycosyltransferase SpsG